VQKACLGRDLARATLSPVLLRLSGSMALVACLGFLAACGDSSAPPSSPSVVTCSSAATCVRDIRTAGGPDQIALPSTQYLFVRARIHAADSEIPHWWFRFDFTDRVTRGQIEEAVIPATQTLDCIKVWGPASPTITPGGVHVCYARGGGVFFIRKGAQYSAYITPEQTPPGTSEILDTKALLLQFVDSLQSSRQL